MGAEGSKPMKLKTLGGGMQAVPMVQPVQEVEPKEKVVTFVQGGDVLESLRTTCKSLNTYDETAKKETYEVYNSDEMVGFNLKMK